MVLRKLVVPAKERLPLLRMVNLVAPDLEAVKRSPVPSLSTINPAKVVEPEREAIGCVAEPAPRTSNLARGVVVPMPTEPPVNSAE